MILCESTNMQNMESKKFLVAFRFPLVDLSSPEGNLFYWREELTARGVNYSTGGMLETTLDVNYSTEGMLETTPGS